MADDDFDWSTAGRHQPGDIVNRDVVAPFEIELLDPTETARARHAATAGLPTIVVSDGLGGAALRENILASFEETRERFVQAARDQFGGHPVGHREANSSRFRDFRVSFQRDNPGYPVGNLLGLTWALGRDDARLLSPVLETVMAAYDGVLVAEDPLDISGGGVLVLDLAGESGLTGARIFEAGRLLKDPRIETADAVKAWIRSQLEAGYRPVATYVGDLVAPNVRLDEDLNDAYREWRSQSIRVVTQFKAGEVILRKGEPITELAMLALREIEMVGREPAQVGPSGIVASLPGGAVNQVNPLGIGGIHLLVPALLTLILVGLFVLVFLVARHHRERVTAFSPIPTGTSGSADGGITARLARELNDRLIESLKSGDAAVKGFSLAELEAQLKRLEPRFLARIRAFEDRLARLEDKLARVEPGKESLLRSRIDDVRDRLNAELARHEIDLN